MKDLEAEAVFRSLVHIRLGDGKTALFWKDNWLEGRCIHNFTLEVWALVSERARASRTMAVVVHNNAWLEDLVGMLTGAAVAQLVRLWLLIMGVQCEVGVPDSYN